MLVFFVIFAILAEGFCEDAVIEKSTRPCVCGENEVSVKCRTICQPQFCNVSYTTYVCDGVQKCEPGCDCIKNHLRDVYGRCVPIEKCPPPPIQCGENQVPSDCADNYSQLLQITLCRPGCRCIENHTRNSYDDCVPTPPPLDCCENEEASTCKLTCPTQDCNFDPTKYACKPGPCQPGCNCKKGYLRDGNRKCILREMCPPNLSQCGDNEEPTDCARNIRPFDSTLTIKCRPCQCIEGYVRNINGVCVLKEFQCGKNEEPNFCIAIFPSNCPPCRCIANYQRNSLGVCVPVLPQCGENEEPTDCARNIRPFDSTLTIKCRPCQCIEGYVRNINGVCVLKEFQCGKNEEPNVCIAIFPSNCPPCRCIANYQRNSLGVCVPVLPQCGENEEPTDCARNIRPFDSTLTIKCRPCQCIEGYVRNINGVCVLKAEFCKNEPNTTYTLCPNRCKSTCKNPNGICSSDCRESYGCGCKPGYLHSEEGKCILPEDCPGGNPCGRNQTFVYCNSGCQRSECPTTNRRGIIACSPPNPCPSGCACKRNYKQQKHGLCIHASECPPVKCPENERWNSCPGPCFSENCGDKQTKIACMTLIAHECQPQCVCKENHLRNTAGKCIHISQCPPQCGENEEPTDCSDTCPQPLATDVASARIRCQPGCKCIAGHIRDSTGACVRKQLQCGKNEEPNFCIAIFPSNCQPCRCIANHERNSLGVCVPTSPLPQCGKNEEPNDCSIIYSQPIQVEKSIDTEQIRIKCQPCKCIKGYERNIKGVCVQKKVIKCGENEELSDCEHECPPQTCSWNPMLMDCKPVECKPGCNCVKGYLRDANGTCILRENCPECNGDKNAMYTKCPNQCVSTCKKPNAICSQECGEPFGCKCKYGYILSEEGRCILPKECPGGNPCGRNETFFGCVYGCPTNDCPRDASGAIAQCLPPNPCPSGCACQTNYKRVSFENKKCILASDCPPIKCGKNENYNPCTSACFSEDCGSPQLEPKTCNTLVPNVCRPRCVCKTDFRRNSSGYCIHKEKCPPQCGENEVPTDCGDIYPQLLTTDVDSESIRRCQPGCTCIAGYTRDSNGVCALTPQKCPGKNEAVNPCPSACFGDGCGELDEDTAACDTLVPHVCKPRCMCRKGYRRDCKGDCIPKEKCPAVS